MKLFECLFPGRKNIEALTCSLRENGERLTAIGASLQRGLDTAEIERTLGDTSKHLQSLSAALAQSASRPIPVQTFPIIDDLRFEEAKGALTRKVAEHLAILGERFVAHLSEATKPVDRAMTEFFDELGRCRKNGQPMDKDVLSKALDCLICCSPKRVVASFQEHSLQAGWAYVSNFNRIVDGLASQFPRCRAGIFSSRLNYADVLQISEEILATLRATSTVLEDIQRRHDTLDALQGELRSDLESSEISKIWEAIWASFRDNATLSADDDGWLSQLKHMTGGVTGGAFAWAAGLLASPGAQFQGQLAREQRIRVFLATSVVMQQGWKEWSNLNKSIVRPHLKVMFALKSDFAANRVLCMCDLLTVNGYSLGEENLRPLYKLLPSHC